MLEMYKNFHDNEGIYKPMQLNLVRRNMEEKVFEKKVYKVLVLFWNNLMYTYKRFVF